MNGDIKDGWHAPTEGKNKKTVEIEYQPSERDIPIIIGLLQTLSKSTGGDIRRIKSIITRLTAAIEVISNS